MEIENLRKAEKSKSSISFLSSLSENEYINSITVPNSVVLSIILCVNYATMTPEDELAKTPVH